VTTMWCWMLTTASETWSWVLGRRLWRLQRPLRPPHTHRLHLVLLHLHLGLTMGAWSWLSLALRQLSQSRLPLSTVAMRQPPAAILHTSL
jgi:hypothetical protein